jgi:SulP family sulfate permease
MERFFKLSRMPKSDAVVMFCAFILTVVFDLIMAIQVGLVLAAPSFVRRMEKRLKPPDQKNKGPARRSPARTPLKYLPSPGLCFSPIRIVL